MLHIGCSENSYNNDAPVTATMQVTLVLYRKQLLHDIAICAYVEGLVIGKDGAEHRHVVQDVVQSGNIDRVERMAEMAVARGRELLYPYVKTEPVDGVLTNERPEDSDAWVIEMNVPEGMSQTSIMLLKEVFHEYVVDSVMADWMSITNPAKAQLWAYKAEEAGREVRASLHARRNRVRRALHPFG